MYQLSEVKNQEVQDLLCQKIHEFFYKDFLEKMEIDDIVGLEDILFEAVCERIITLNTADELYKEIYKKHFVNTIFPENQFYSVCTNSFKEKFKNYIKNTKGFVDFKDLSNKEQDVIEKFVHEIIQELDKDELNNLNLKIDYEDLHKLMKQSMEQL